MRCCCIILTWVTLLLSSAYYDMKACRGPEFVLWTVVPVESNGYSLLGESGKWVSISQQRFLRISSLPESTDSSSGGDTSSATSGSLAEGMEVWLQGPPGEEVSVRFLGPGGGLITVTCVLGEGRGRAVEEGLMILMVSSSAACS